MMMVVDIIFLLGILAGAVVPGNSFSAKGYDDDNYYDHIIDFGIEHLQLIKEGFYVDVKEPDWGVGSMVFNGLRSLRRAGNPNRAATKSKRLKNGDLDLLSTFQFGNISGGASFYVDNGKQEHQKNSFQFHGSSPKVEVYFMLTKNQFLKRVAFQFVEPPVYNHSRSLTLNVTQLLEEKGATAFNRLFKDLYNIIYERMILTPDRHHPYFDKILDNVFIDITKEPESFTNENQITKTSPNETIKAELIITFYGLTSAKRLKRTHSLTNEHNGDVDLRTTIQIGNASGKARISGTAMDAVFQDSFTFTSSPVVVEALFYFPWNQSHQQMSFHFETKPNFTIHPEKEYFRSSIEKLLEGKAPAMYGQALYYLLNETYPHVHDKTAIPKVAV